MKTDTIQLKQIIKEELARILVEDWPDQPANENVLVIAKWLENERYEVAEKLMMQPQLFLRRPNSPRPKQWSHFDESIGETS